MRPVLRGILAVLLSLVWLLAAILVWFNYSAIGLPDMSGLQAYAPNTTAFVPASACLPAIQAASPTDLQKIYPALAAAESDPKRDIYATQIARSMVCHPMPYRLIVELRIALQVRRKFSLQDQQTIYLNRAYFGDCGQGVAAASQLLFGVSPSRLDVAQAALLVDLLRRGERDSPLKHPDRALARRNQVLDQMTAQGSLSSAQAAAAKSLPLELRD